MLLGWSPDAFWSSTPLDFFAAWDFYRRRHKLDASAPMTHDELDEMMERFPDGD